jgi:hypothetical protein
MGNIREKPVQTIQVVPKAGEQIDDEPPPILQPDDCPAVTDPRIQAPVAVVLPFQESGG